MAVKIEREFTSKDTSSIGTKVNLSNKKLSWCWHTA